MSENQLTLFAALAQAQSEFPVIDKTKKANYGMYADLTVIVEKIRPVLSKHGLCFSQGVEGAELITHLFHKDGNSMSGKIPFVIGGKQGPQDVGSALTYARRYGLCALLGIVADEDDDGRQAQASSGQQQRPAQAKGAASNPASKGVVAKSVEEKKELTPEEKKKADEKARLLGFDNYHKHAAMVKMVWITARKAGWTKEDIVELLKKENLPTSTRDLHWADLNKLKTHTELNKPAREPGQEG